MTKLTDFEAYEYASRDYLLDIIHDLTARIAEAEVNYAAECEAGYPDLTGYYFMIIGNLTFELEYHQAHYSKLVCSMLTPSDFDYVA